MPDDVLQIAVVMPVFDDWQAAGEVLGQLDAILVERTSWRAQAILLDDGSGLEPSADDLPSEVRALAGIRRLRLRRNLGHQRAIAVGLAYVHEHTAADVVVVMDADGEDRPADVPRLVDELLRLGSKRVVFAERARRTEGLLFRLGYLGYRVLHRVLVGFMTRVGNFSAIPRDHLSRLVVVSELWNHYAAAVFKSRIPLATLPADRGRRLHGRSHMNLVSLVVHGLSALAVFGEVVGVRVLLAVTGCAASALLVVGVVLGLRFSGQLVLPPWAVPATALFLVLVVQAASTGFLMAFSLLALRSRLDFLPARDYQDFVGEVVEVAPAHA